MISQVSLIPRKGYNAVLGFKAPYTGKLRIYLRRGFNMNSDVCGLKILHNQDKIYPASGEWYNIDYAANKASIYPPLLTGNYENWNTEFPEGIAVDVKAGDMIYIHAKGNSDKNVGLISYNRGFEFRYDDYVNDKYIFLNRTESSVAGENFNLGIVTNCDDVHYYSSNEDVVTVDSEGNVFTKNAGMSTIYAVGDNAIADYIVLRVFRELTIDCDSIVFVGDKVSLKAEYSDGVPDSSVRWSVRDSSIAKITDDGLLYGVGEGSTVISAECGFYSVNKIINVTHSGIVDVKQNADGNYDVSLTASIDKLTDATMYVAVKEEKVCKNIYFSNILINLDDHTGKFEVHGVQFDESKDIIEIYVWNNVISPILNVFKYDGEKT